MSVIDTQIQNKSNKIICIASSTGGPRTLNEIIPYLDSDLNAPVLVIQHMPDGFTKSLAERLNDISKIDVYEADEEMEILPGKVYIAKAGKHMKIRRRMFRHIVELTDEPLREGVKPCANYTFESLINSSYDEIICVVLTGMGTDGTEGINKLSEKKKVSVIVQDEESSVVYGMPGSIIKSEIPCRIVSLKDISQTLKSLV